MQNQIAEYKQQIDTSINHYCQRLLLETKRNFTPYSSEAVGAYCSLLQRGGKRVRGALTMATYHMVGGRDDATITSAACIVEMLNATLLIFDDMADLSALRRGGPTVHTMLADYHRQHNLRGDSAHFGQAMGLHIGLLGTYLVMDEIQKLAVSNVVKIATTDSLNRIITTTVHGQFNDIVNEAVQQVSEEHVRQTLTWKTAYYTFLQPLQFGMILAGSKDTELACVRDYAMNLGLSFQIIDDILGTFGDQAETGKSTQDDIKEGKITVLVAHALRQATAAQKDVLLLALGNSALTTQQYELCKKVIQDTGGLDYAQSLANTHAKLAIRALNNAPKEWVPDGLAFLRSLAQYVTARNV